MVPDCDQARQSRRDSERYSDSPVHRRPSCALLTTIRTAQPAPSPRGDGHQGGSPLTALRDSSAGAACRINARTKEYPVLLRNQLRKGMLRGPALLDRKLGEAPRLFDAACSVYDAAATESFPGLRGATVLLFDAWPAFPALSSPTIPAFLQHRGENRSRRSRRCLGFPSAASPVFLLALVPFSRVEGAARRRRRCTSPLRAAISPPYAGHPTDSCCRT